MDKFRVQLYEESQALHLLLDSRGGREFSLRSACGALSRACGDGWQSQARETSSPQEAAAFLSWPELERVRKPFERLPDDAGEILEDNAFLCDFLRRLDLPEWRLQFRGYAVRRLIRNTHRRVLQNGMRRFSVSARFRLRGQTGQVEVGEGSCDGLKFNADGLARRIDEALAGVRLRRRVAFGGQVPVVLQAGEGGILFHEILGHALEADYVHQGVSPFSRADLDRPVVSAAVTVLCRDERDPFFRDAGCDDEGEACSSPLLVERGVLRRFISDYAHQKLLRLRDRGHARLEDFSRIPQPRMHATYVQPGSVPPDEIIASVAHGVYAREFGDGGLDFRSGRFHFRIRQAFLIENGRLGPPIGSLSVGGDVREVLNSVRLVGNDFKYDRGVSYCQKNGQVLPVRVGQPTMRIDRMWVSGEHDA